MTTPESNDSTERTRVIFKVGGEGETIEVVQEMTHPPRYRLSCGGFMIEDDVDEWIVTATPWRQTLEEACGDMPLGWVLAVPCDVASEFAGQMADIWRSALAKLRAVEQTAPTEWTRRQTKRWGQFWRSHQAPIRETMWIDSPRLSPARLPANAETSFRGDRIRGSGFLLSRAERDALVGKDPRNAERIFPYVGRHDLESSPTQTSDRFVISFERMSLEEAARWPDLLDIVRAKVKPERDKILDEHRRKYWWRFEGFAGSLRNAIEPLSRCLVSTELYKVPIFAFQPIRQVFEWALRVYAFDDDAHFAVLQSRVYAAWVHGVGEIVAASSFPFPEVEKLGPLEAAGRAFDEARARYMRDEGVGLAVTYARMNHPRVARGSVEHLRELTSNMDRAVLGAYGWDAIEPPPFAADNRVFEKAIVDRLFALNAERALPEQARRRPPPAAVPEADDSQLDLPFDADEPNR